MRVESAGELELLSTHDQLLGGPSGQTYLGASFQQECSTGRGSCAKPPKWDGALRAKASSVDLPADFVVSRTSRASGTLAIEVNLRKGGTTHPFLTLQYLTDGRYDAEADEFRTAHGHPKHYVASDHVASPAYRMSPRRFC